MGQRVNPDQKNKLKRGQSILEFVVLALPLSVVLFFIFQSVFIMAGRSYFDHLLYESLFCMARGKSVFYCKNSLIKNGEFFLKGSQLKNIQLTEFNKKYSGSLIWRVKPWRIQLKKTLKVPEDLLQ